MKTAIKLFAVFVIALFALGAFGAAYAASDETQYIAITDVNYDDPIAPGATLAVEVELTNSHPAQDFEEVNVKAWLVDSFGDRITDKAVAGPMQIQQDSEKTLTLNIAVPSDVEPGDYKLIVEAEGIWEKGTHRETVKAENTVEIEQNDDAFFVQSIRTDKDNYYASDKVDAAVTVMNNGIEDQDNIVVSIAIPELGIEKSLKIFGTLFAGNSQTMYFTFDLPEDADGGIYTLTATAGNALAKASSSTDFEVKKPIVVDTSTNVKSTTVNLDDLDVNEAETFQLAISNKDLVTKSYEISANADWATITASPAKFDLRPGQTQTVTISVTAEQSGEHTADVLILENGKAISSVEIDANAETQLTTIGAVIVALAFILAAIIVYTQFCRNGNSGSKGTAKHIYY